MEMYAKSFLLFHEKVYKMYSKINLLYIKSVYTENVGIVSSIVQLNVMQKIGNCTQVPGNKIRKFGSSKKLIPPKNWL